MPVWLRWFDAALAGYFLGTLFAVFGIVHRYCVWLQRPSTAARLAGIDDPLWAPHPPSR